METTNKEKPIIINSNLFTETERPPLSIFGWEVDRFPKKPAEVDGYQPTPTTIKQVQTSTAGAIPKSIVTPFDAADVWKGDICVNVIPGVKVSNDAGVEFWSAEGGAIVEVLTRSPIYLDTNLIITAAVPIQPNSVGAGYHVEINNTVLKSGNNYYDTNNNWHQVIIPISAGWLQASGETNKIDIMPTNAGAWISSVELSAGTVPTSASYYWECISSGKTTPNTPQTVSIEVTEGTTSTTDEINSFAAEIGISVSADGVEEALAGISAKLSASFTVTSTNEHSLAISKSTSKNWSTKIELVKNEKSITYQIWQLVIQYEVNGKILNQKVPMGTAPFVIGTYVEK